MTEWAVQDAIMSPTRNDGELKIAVVTSLTPEQRSQAEWLVKVCRVQDRLELPVNLEDLVPSKADGTLRLLAYYDGEPAGLAVLEGAIESELYLMIHPDFRRRGIGTALLNFAADRCRRGGSVGLQLVSEATSVSGNAFARSMGAEYRFSEYGMELEAVPALDGAAKTLELRAAGAADIPLVTELTAAAFGQDERSFSRRYAREVEEENIRFFLASHRDEAIGVVRLISFGPEVYITAFGVLTPYRGQGFGREILTRIVRMLAGEGWGRINIEVVTENRNALSLYRSCGFREVCTYNYFSVQLAQRM